MHKISSYTNKLKNCFLPQATRQPLNISACLCIATSLVLFDLQADAYQEPTTTQPQIGVNLAARPVITDGWNLFVNGEVLYWQAIEDNMVQSVQGFDGSGFTGSPTKRKLISLEFDWDCGYRVCAGYNIPRDGWSLSLEWTSIRNRGSSYVGRVLAPNSNQNEDLFQTWGNANHQIPGGIFSSRAQLHINLEQIDLQCGREFYYGKFLTIQPHIGARNSWIRQKFSIYTQNSLDTLNSQLCKFHNDFWGFGFVAGLDTDWKFGDGFSLYSVSDFSILFGLFKIKEKIFFGLTPSSVSPTGTHIPSSEGMNLVSNWKNSLKEGTGVLDLALGLKWTQPFSKDRYRVTIKAGYEYHLYIDQNHFYNAFQQTPSPSTNNLYHALGGNLIYQGISGSLQFDF